MIIMIIMKRMTCADLVWVATAMLSREQPDRTGFSSAEIRGKIDEIEPGNGFASSTIPTHIAIHCVANKKPDPLRHRKLYCNLDETYRLYYPGDTGHPERSNGKTLPKAEQLPPQYRDLLEWYGQQQKAAGKKYDQDPILALRGVGKELWRSLGGGEKFIREMRENWYGKRPTPDSEAAPRKEKRAS
jgi:hypothetical protein